jgi:hypothetical protein
MWFHHEQPEPLFYAQQQDLVLRVDVHHDLETISRKQTAERV